MRGQLWLKVTRINQDSHQHLPWQSSSLNDVELYDFFLLWIREIKCDNIASRSLPKVQPECEIDALNLKRWLQPKVVIFESHFLLRFWILRSKLKVLIFLKIAPLQLSKLQLLNAPKLLLSLLFMQLFMPILLNVLGIVLSKHVLLPAMLRLKIFWWALLWLVFQLRYQPKGRLCAKQLTFMLFLFQSKHLYLPFSWHPL